MALNRHFAYGVEGKHSFLTPFFALASECPLYIIDCVEIALPNPLGVFVGVPPLGPTPEVMPRPIGDVAEGFFADHTSVVASKTSENWIQLLNDYFLFCPI
jgi:hypothetical protein